MQKLINKSLIGAAITAFSFSALAGHHEKGEEAMEMAEGKSSEMAEMAADEVEAAKAKVKAMQTDVSGDDLKAKIDAAQAEADMMKLQDEAEAAVEEVAPE